MSTPRASLDQIERWMQSVLMHPGGVAEGVGSAEAREHLDIGLDELDSVVLRSNALTSAERLEIYVDAYHERLLECLREEFPFTRGAVGDELFDALAFGYLQRHPSRSYTLGTLGAGLPDYLAECRLHEQAHPDGAIATWTDFVIELAALERLQREIFDGPGSEEAAAIDMSQLAAIPAEARSAARLTPCPSLRLRRFEHPVHEYWEACKQGDHPAAPAAKQVCLAIWRRNFVVYRYPLAAAEMSLLELLVGSQSVGDAISQAANAAEPGQKSADAVLGGWFARWIAERFFVGIQRP